MSAAPATNADLNTEPMSESEALTRLPIVLERDAIGKWECIGLLHTCIFHGWVEAIPSLAAADSCCNNEEQQVAMFESAMASNEYDTSTSEAIWNILVNAWPEVLNNKLEYLTSKAFETQTVPPASMAKELLHKLKSKLSQSDFVFFLDSNHLSSKGERKR